MDQKQQQEKQTASWAQKVFMIPIGGCRTGGTYITLMTLKLSRNTKFVEWTGLSYCKRIWTVRHLEHRLQKTIFDKSISVKGKRYGGGKKSKQVLTVLLPTNAVGEKESHIITGKSTNPRCFETLKDKKRSYGSCYHANDSAWIDFELRGIILKAHSQVWDNFW